MGGTLVRPRINLIMIIIPTPRFPHLQVGTAFVTPFVLDSIKILGIAGGL